MKAVLDRVAAVAFIFITAAWVVAVAVAVVFWVLWVIILPFVFVAALFIAIAGYAFGATPPPHEPFDVPEKQDCRIIDAWRAEIVGNRVRFDGVLITFGHVQVLPTPFLIRCEYRNGQRSYVIPLQR